MIELLVVISIIAILGSLGIGAFTAARRNYMLEGSAAEIATVLRAARNSAILARSPTRVLVDPLRRTISAYAFETIDQWSFEDASAAAESAFARAEYTVHAAARVPGRVGEAVAFDGIGSYVDCGRHEKYSPRESLLFEAWIEHRLAPRIPEPASEAGTRGRIVPGRSLARGAGEDLRSFAIADREGSWGLWMTEARGLEVRVGEWRARTPSELVLPDRWVRVAFRFEHGAVELRIDGVPRALETVARGPTVTARVKSDGASAKDPSSGAPLEIPPSGAPFTISHAEFSFPGAIDEAVLRGESEPQSYEYPESEHIVGWRRVIAFDGDGRLDPSRHDSEVEIHLVELPDFESAERMRSPTAPIDPSLTFSQWLERARASGALRAGAAGGGELRPDPERIAAREAARLGRIEGVRTRVVRIDRLGVVR